MAKKQNGTNKKNRFVCKDAHTNHRNDENYLDYVSDTDKAVSHKNITAAITDINAIIEAIMPIIYEQQIVIDKLELKDWEKTIGGTLWK